MIYPRQALRSLLKTPLVSAVAVLSLALGIGANAAIFSVFERLILRPLTVVEPERLVNLSSPGPKSGRVSSNLAGDTASIFSYPMFRDLEKTPELFTGIAAHRAVSVNLAQGGTTLNGEAMLVSGGYFSVLGLHPVLGRLISPEDDRVPGGHPVVVLSHAWWRERFAADPAVVGSSLTVNGRPMTIIGVAPPGFEGTTLGQDPSIFVPLTMMGVMSPGWDGFENRRNYCFYMFARLAPGSSREEAAAAINVVYHSLINDVEVPLQGGMSERGLERFKTKELILEPGSHGQSSLKSEIRTPLALLLAVAGLVLLIAGANIANLLLVRATNRSGEIAVRLSIGAQRHHIVGLLLTESFLLAVLGGLGGLLVAAATLKLIASRLMMAGPNLAFELSPAMWLFLAVLSVVTGLAGLFPALHSARKDLAGSLKSQAARASASPAAKRFHAAMVTLQIALAMALLISAGLFARSLVNVTRVDLGFEIEHLATFGISPELNGYTVDQSRNLFERLEEDLRALPGVESAAASVVPLIADDTWMSNVTVQGFEATPDSDTHARYNMIGPGFFETLGIPLLAGRDIEPRDAFGAPKVALINESFARKFGLDPRDAVGKRMRDGAGGELDIEIIGLVPDTRYAGVKEEMHALFFVPYRQEEELGAINFYIRSRTAPEQLLGTLRKAVARHDPDLPVENPRTMVLQVRENVQLDRMLSTVSTAFAVLATLLAAVGLYGVLAYSVTQRRREIGLRMALGADAHRVRGLVLGDLGRLTLIGGVLGVLGALGLERLASSLLYGVAGHDPLVMASAVALLAAVALGAGLLPAQRAARLDPVKALREE